MKVAFPDSVTGQRHIVPPIDLIARFPDLHVTPDVPVEVVGEPLPLRYREDERAEGQ